MIPSSTALHSDQDAPCVTQVEALTAINVEAMLDAVGLGQVRCGRRLISRLCVPAARRFACELAEYDRIVGQRGLAEGAAWILGQRVRRVEVAGQEYVPRHGPLLVVANHPGLSDTVALFASLPRSDMTIVAADRPFLRALPQTSRSLLYVSEQPEHRLSAVRRVASALESGRAVLTFPGGEIEPDPAIRSDAACALERWSPSIGLLVKLVRDVQVVPAIVSGVFSARAQRHPFTRLRRRPEDREWLGAILQMILPGYQAVTVRIAYGQSLALPDLLMTNSDPRALTRQIVRKAQQLVERPPQKWQTLIDAASPDQVDLAPLPVDQAGAPYTPTLRPRSERAAGESRP